ncbi:MAG: Flp pilus assembly protein CpaB [Planctomycetaceae bacterium]|nr:Flp pilus assembly protein CpaB [Planctomycetaceae bacterium]
MKPKTVVLLAVAVGSGLLAMIGVQQAMSTSQQAQPEETVKVLTALTDIQIGVPLQEATNVEFQEVPKSGVVVDDAILSAEQFEKRSPLYAIKAGDMIRLSKLSAPGVHGKSQQIPTGMRVLTIPVDDTGSFAGLLSPGDRVDVMVTYNYRDQRGRQQTQTKTLLEFVEVFATDDKTAREADVKGGEGKSKTRTVQLLLAPEHVPYVKLAESKGKLALSWRRRDDDELASVGPINEELFNELQGLDTVTSVPGYEQFAPPLYGGETASGGGEFPAATADFGGIGRRQQEPATAAAPSSDLDSLLTEAETGALPIEPAEVVAAEPPAPPKPTWNLQIYVGNQAVEQSFELPEEVDLSAEVGTEAEMQELRNQVQGNELWGLLKQAL